MTIRNDNRIAAIAKGDSPAEIFEQKGSEYTREISEELEELKSKREEIPFVFYSLSTLKAEVPYVIRSVIQ